MEKILPFVAVILHDVFNFVVPHAFGDRGEVSLEYVEADFFPCCEHFL